MSPRKKRKRLSPFQVWAYSILGRIVLEFLSLTNRWDVEGEEHLRRARESGLPTLLLAWHGRMSYGSFYLYKIKLQPWTVASFHGDGEIMARVVKNWGFKLIRGSSGKGGQEVLRKMDEIFSSKDNFVGLTSDGPKGPAQIAKPGSVGMARKHGAAILTLSGTSSRYWELKSWDRFRLPKPFGRIKITVAPPLVYPQTELTPDEESRLVSEYINANQEYGDSR